MAKGTFVGSRSLCEELFRVSTKSVENILSVSSFGLQEGKTSGFFGFCMFTQFLDVLSIPQRPISLSSFDPD